MDGPDQLFRSERQSMVEKQLRERGIHDERVLAAMNKVPRHEFVHTSHWPEAYADHPVGIAEQQTTSQPYIIAAMLQAVALRPQDLALEIGAGSGYQTALLAELVSHVVAIERHANLTEEARRVLGNLGYRNITLITSDGTLGAREGAPFDVIIVSAAAPMVPPALVEQLAMNGRLILPVGDNQQQVLQIVRRTAEGVSVHFLEGCRFVPLIGQQGFAA
jgi:protein-L-isoaspartate(D-aspartate) O-methyltransferase